jgi:hypothetical protein
MVTMKNLLIYIHPDRFFHEDYARLVKVQIENSFRLGWKKEDILMVTNFPYSYMGVDAFVVDDSLFCEHRKKASKINVIYSLLEKGIINELCWFHDFDAYQLLPFGEIDLDGKDAGFTDYGYSDYWNTGSFFFLPSSIDIFEWIQREMNRKKSNEERALMVLTDHNINSINSRYKRLNCTYNLGRMRQTDITLAKADKPIQVLHFHPRMKELFDDVKYLLPTPLLTIFIKNGYE